VAKGQIALSNLTRKCRTMETILEGKTPFPASLEIKSGDTLYRITSIFADKGDFRAMWEELIIKALQEKTGGKAG
jgi:hypothetical protein